MMLEAPFKKVSSRKRVWETVLGACPRVVQIVQRGVDDEPSVPFTNGIILPELRHSQEDLAFGTTFLRRSCARGLYEVVPESVVDTLVRNGQCVSSGYIEWQEAEGGQTGRLIVEYGELNLHWRRRVLRESSLRSFCLKLLPGEKIISFDIKEAYHHVHLADSMRGYFVFRFNGVYYKPFVLPTGWAQSRYWFAQVMSPIVLMMERVWGYRVHRCVDDFAIAPSATRPATNVECAVAKKRITDLLEMLGIERNRSKDKLSGTSELPFLGIVIDTVRMSVRVQSVKARIVRNLASVLVQWCVRVQDDMYVTTRSNLTRVLRSTGLFTVIYPSLRNQTVRLQRDLHAANGDQLITLHADSLRELHFWAELSSPQSIAMSILSPRFGTLYNWSS